MPSIIDQIKMASLPGYESYSGQTVDGDLGSVQVPEPGKYGPVTKLPAWEIDAARRQPSEFNKPAPSTVNQSQPLRGGTSIADRVAKITQVIEEDRKRRTTYERNSDENPYPEEYQNRVELDEYRRIPRPDRSRLEEAIAERDRLKTMKPADLDTNNDKWYTNVGKSLALALPQIQQQLANPNINDKQALGISVGNAIGAAITGLVAPHADESRQLEYLRDKQDKEVAAQQALYDKSMEGAVNEARIENYESMGDKRISDAERDRRRADSEAIRASSGRLNAMMRMVNSGIIDLKDNEDFVDSMSAVVGAKVTINDFNPATDAVKDVKIVTDAENNRTFVVKIDKGGKIITTTVKDEETGKTAIIKNPLVKAAEIRAASDAAIAEKRIISAEKIAKLTSDTRLRLGEMGYDAKEIDVINDDFQKQYESTDEDEIIESLNTTRKAQGLPELTQAEKEQAVQAYYDSLFQNTAKRYREQRGKK